MTQQTIDHFTASDSIGRANGNYTKVEEFGVPAPAMTLPPQVEVHYSDIQRMLEAGPRYGIEFVTPES